MSSHRRTVDTLMEDELREEAERAAGQEEKAANRQVQEQMLTALGQLNQRLERLEARQSSAGSIDGSFLQVDSSQSGQGAP